jgi:hypothetical protein
VVQHTKKGKNVPKRGKICQMAICKLCMPNGRKIDQMDIKYVYQHLPLLDPPKFTQIGIFGLQRNHRATLAEIP